jgi:hypothetical protein
LRSASESRRRGAISSARQRFQQQSFPKGAADEREISTSAIHWTATAAGLFGLDSIFDEELVNHRHLQSGLSIPDRERLTTNAASDRVWLAVGSLVPRLL